LNFDSVISFKKFYLLLVTIQESCTSSKFKIRFFQSYKDLALIRHKCYSDRNWPQALLLLTLVTHWNKFQSLFEKSYSYLNFILPRQISDLDGRYHGKNCDMIIFGSPLSHFGTVLSLTIFLPNWSQNENKK